MIAILAPRITVQARMRKSGSRETSLYRTQTQQVAALVLARSWRNPREEEDEGEVGEDVEEFEAKDGENKKNCKKRAVHKKHSAVGELGLCDMYV